MTFAGSEPELVDLIDAADLGIVMQRVHHQSLLLRLDGDQILAPVERHFADARLPRHSLAHDGERRRRHRTIRRKVVRAIDVDRIDRRVVGELREVDHTSRLDSDLLDVLLGHHDVAALLELVALGELGVGTSRSQCGHQRFCWMRVWHSA